MEVVVLVVSALICGILFGAVIGALASAYVIKRLIQADEEVNHDLLGGAKGETMSSRGGKAVLRKLQAKTRPGDGGWCLLCRMLNWLQANHCLINIQPNVGEPVDMVFYANVMADIKSGKVIKF